MRVTASGLRVFMTTDAVGGVWSYASDLAQALCAGGATVTLAVLGPEPSAAQARQAAAAGLSLLSTGLELDWTVADDDGARAIAASVRRLAAGADIVHLHSGGLLSGGYTAPVVVTCHSCVATWWQAVRGGPLPQHFARQRDRVAAGYADADALIAPSQAFAAATTAAYGAAVQPHVVPNGRAPSGRISANIEPANTVFTSGRLWDAGKNLAVLDQVAGLIPWPVFAAGSADGPNGERAGFDHVRALGWLSHDQIADRLAASPVYASAARYEPFGLSVLEAAQAGCALVLSDLPTFRELWHDAAIFVGPDDVPGFAAAISGLMQSPARRQALSVAACVRATRYSVAAMAAGTLGVYHRQRARAAA